MNVAIGCSKSNCWEYPEYSIYLDNEIYVHEKT